MDGDGDRSPLVVHSKAGVKPVFRYLNKGKGLPE